MTTRLVRALQHSKCVPEDDFLVLCLATNEDRNFLVVEAYAGTGKTTLLLDVIRRLDCEKCILLSFSRTAVKVARVRLIKQTGEWLTTQTFDSLFLHLHGARVRSESESSESASFQQYRDMVVQTTLEDLDQFVCRTRNARYHFRDIQYVFVDEAQDSPPESFQFLNLCREQGKCVIVTGDRKQAIFRFMNTASLFDVIPECHSVRHRLTVSRRCIQDICDYVNGRFGVSMRSTREYSSYCSEFLDVSFQCRLNSTMGQLYVTLMSTTAVKVKVNVASGESTDKFYEHAWSEIMLRYGVHQDRAREILSYMQERSARCRGPAITLTTVHRFKGDESDLTILASDLDIEHHSDDPTEENVKYVACTRPRYGLLQTTVPTYVGNPAPLQRLSTLFQARTLFPGTSSVSQVVNSPVTLIRMMGTPGLREVVHTAYQSYRQRECTWSSNGPVGVHPAKCRDPQCATLVGTACDVAVTWMLERKARQASVANVLAKYPEFAVSIKDDRKLHATLAQGIVSPEVVGVYKRMILRAKLLSLMGRYLVVRHSMHLHHPVVVRGVFGSAYLQSYVYFRSVLVFKREVSRCCVADFVNLAHSFQHDLPPLLRDATHWHAVSFHGAISSEPLTLRGTYDVVVYDKMGRTHVVEVKCVRHLKFTHFWQTLMYSVMVNNGVTAHLSHVWSLRDNQLFTLPASSVASLSASVFAATEAFNRACSCKSDPQFYAKTYDATELQPPKP